MLLVAKKVMKCSANLIFYVFYQFNNVAIAPEVFYLKRCPSESVVHYSKLICSYAAGFQVPLLVKACTCFLLQYQLQFVCYAS